MGIIRPATPGFLVTLVATVLLAVVSFCVPYFKSVYFLKATISVSGHNGSITFGTLGYCLELSNGTTCSTPAVGYELDINGLVGNKLPVKIPQVVVKWLTYCLVLHIVALGLSAGSAIFGLLAHVREMSMTCCSTCVSGFAAAVALLAFIFDIAIFFAAKARINAVGSAQIGNATWLTLAAWVLLFFSGCFYTIGRCCISKRGPRSGKWDKVQSQVSGHEEQMRLDAVKAEADRKAKQKQVEGGLPAFHEVQPLTGHIDGDKVYIDEPQQQNTIAGVGARPFQGGAYSNGGYVQKAPGSRAVDEYYSPTQEHPPTTYPPAPQATNYGPTGYAQNVPPPATPHRQPSGYAQSQYSKSNYAQSTYNYNAPQTSSPPPANQYLSTTTPYASDPYGVPGHEYGHTAGGSSYHTAASHDRQATTYSNYDPYDSQQQTSYNNYSNTAYNNTPPAAAAYALSPSNYYQAQSPPTGPSHQNERSYTLGGSAYAGDGYGANSVPPLPEPGISYFPAQSTSSPLALINTDTGYVSPAQTSPVKGPRPQNQLTVRNEDELPPNYEPGNSNVQGAWGKAR
ncbi:putative SUR7/PalI family protein [Lyophyllum shimeji]|uniref:SUR7/PalI family protein n=1 Tax=Lyophyllum shimeji TaxID=47721 RepID=A0A9P3PHZ7_LYOSH|nr:putative SUR7/PalI family protein [Lyophyllum shimeji]